MSDRYLAYDPAKDSDGFEFVYSVMQEGANMLSPPMRTLWQFIIDPRAQRMSFYSHDNSELRYLDLKDFGFSRQSQVEVVDLAPETVGLARS